MSKFSVLAAVGSAVIVTGCAMFPTVSMLDTSLQNVAPEHLGYVTGSIVRTDKYPYYSNIWVTICDKNNKQIAEIWEKQEFSEDKRNLKGEDFLGKTFSVKFPEGKYSICGYGFYTNGGTIQYDIVSKEPFTVPFSVVAGSVNYIGEYREDPIASKNVIGLPIAGGGSWRVSNKQERDVKLELAKKPDMAGLPIITAIPDFTALAEPVGMANVPD